MRGATYPPVKWFVSLGEVDGDDPSNDEGRRAEAARLRYSTPSSRAAAAEIADPLDVQVVGSLNDRLVVGAFVIDFVRRETIHELNVTDANQISFLPTIS
ncbi:hypothetical protein [Halorubrum sp. GN11_10-6_MGM]|uniref:hypothetical protein n=1 Tax=Halorubrum sp. GN11_10-6_MGM TaxID=2518112 RepID=UPI0018EE53A9|nr:hypothetical protein [Halorubrum sp. GN11_10-6_MGM]